MAEPFEEGFWEFAGHSGVIGTQASLLHTGEILFFTRPEDTSHKWGNLNNGLPGDQNIPTCTPDHCAPDTTLSTVVQTSGANAFKPVALLFPAYVENNPFCAGHTFLADGRLLVAGGDRRAHSFYNQAPVGTESGLDSLRVFTPGANGIGEWTRIGRISDCRWYPTCTLLPDGRVFVVSGSIDDQEGYNNQNPTCENIPPLPGGPQYLPLLAAAWPYHSYPFVYVLPSGPMFLFVKDSAFYLRLENDKFGRERWAVEAGPRLPRDEPAKHYPNNGTAVLLPLLPDDDEKKAYTAEVLVIGGGGLNVYVHWDNVPDSGQATYKVDALRNCFRVNVHRPGTGEQWEVTGALEHPRVMPDAVLLPDGKVLVVNGAKKGFAGGYPGTGPCVPEYGTREAEIYDPAKGSWTTVAAATRCRLYHSTALLLPDARVMVAGSDHQKSIHHPDSITHDDPRYKPTIASAYEYQIEIFSPPYLFKETPRPVIKSVQQRVAFGGLFEVEVSRSEGENLSVALLRPGSVTHGNNMSQRHVGLKIVERTSTRLTVQAPPNGNVAPPGYYMLFVLDRGFPSEARFVQLLLDPFNRTASNGPHPTGMALWLRADTGILADATGHITSWADISGRCNDVFWRPNRKLRGKLNNSGAKELTCEFLKADKADRAVLWNRLLELHPVAEEKLQRPPLWLQNELNGHPVVRFSLVSDWAVVWGGYLESANPVFLPGRAPYSAFMVTHPWPGRSNEVEGRAGILGWGDYQGSHVALSFGSGPTIGQLPKDPGKASVVTSWGEGKQLGSDDEASVPLFNAVLLETSFDGARAQMRLNGHAIVQGPADGIQTGSGPLTVGRTHQYRGNLFRGHFFRGDIAEIIIYDRSVAGDERYRIQEYLRDKYALW